jgi:hypothetical protein
MMSVSSTALDAVSSSFSIQRIAAAVAVQRICFAAAVNSVVSTAAEVLIDPGPEIRGARYITRVEHPYDVGTIAQRDISFDHAVVVDALRSGRVNAGDGRRAGDLAVVVDQVHTDAGKVDAEVSALDAAVVG